MVGDDAYVASERALNDGSGGGGMGKQRKRLRAATTVPHPGPCLIDLWTGQVVARNAETEGDNSSSRSSGKIVKVQNCRVD